MNPTNWTSKFAPVAVGLEVLDVHSGLLLGHLLRDRPILELVSRGQVRVLEGAAVLDVRPSADEVLPRVDLRLVRPEPLPLGEGVVFLVLCYDLLPVLEARLLDNGGPLVSF